MSKKTLILISCLVLSLTLGLGGSLAYLTDTDTEINTFTMGNVDIDVVENFPESELKPGVTVTKEAQIVNTGSNDAWVWLTVAIPEQIADVVTPNWVEGVVPDETNATIQDAEGNNYKLYIVTVDQMLPAGQSTGNLLSSVTMSGNVDYVNGQYVKFDENGTPVVIDYDLSNFDVIVTGYAIQTDGFANVDQAYAAYNAQWGEAVLDSTTVEVGADDELKEALATDVQNIVVELTEDVTYAISSWNQLAIGGDSTEKVTIIGNGHTLTFNQKDSDWDNVVTNNGATLVLKDVNITNSGYNDGPWNRHDINFGCNVEMTNVTSDKALAFKAGAKLNNVTINDANTEDTYAIWIQPNGQTVTLDGCTIDMLACTDGRGIKIDEQYVTTPAKVTLVVKNTTFKTEEKAAILVKSAAGADITLENVDISGVAADFTSAVWVDEASAAYYDLVTVNGGYKHQE